MRKENHGPTSSKNTAENRPKGIHVLANYTHMHTHSASYGTGFIPETQGWLHKLNIRNSTSRIHHHNNRFQKQQKEVIDATF